MHCNFFHYQTCSVSFSRETAFILSTSVVHAMCSIPTRHPGASTHEAAGRRFCQSSLPVMWCARHRWAQWMYRTFWFAGRIGVFRPVLFRISAADRRCLLFAASGNLYGFDKICRDASGGDVVVAGAGFDTSPASPLKAFVDGPRRFARAEPPIPLHRGDFIVADMVLANTLTAYEESAWTWVRSAWEPWKDHWEQARQWVAEACDG